MVRPAVLALVLLTPSVASAQAAAPAPAPEPQAIATSTSLLSRAVEDANTRAADSIAPSQWVDSPVAIWARPRVPLPEYQRLSLTTPEDFWGGLLFTGGMTVLPWPQRASWTLRATTGKVTAPQSPSRPARP